MKKDKAEKITVAKPAAKLMTSLDELQNLVDAPVKCTFKLDGQTLEIAVKRMTPAIAERQRAILRAVQPPYLKERNDYNPLDATYLKLRDAADDKARCVVVYFCCPIISAAKACASDDEITAFVQSKLTRHLQELIALTAQAGGMAMSDAANFTAADGSES
jgi:hypothetical protein